MLSTKTLAICCKQTLLETGDARMAFVLGHELGYMAEDDYWHFKTFMTLDGDSE